MNGLLNGYISRRAAYLYLLQEMRCQPLHVHSHVLLEHLGQVSEERVTVLMELSGLEL